MKTQISIYRNFTIYFDHEDEKFFAPSIEDGKRRQSFSSCKKSIDDHLKINSSFESFYVYKNEYDRVGIVKITSIRKDGRLSGIRIDDNRKVQISDYDLKYYHIYDQSNDALVKKIEQEKIDIGKYITLKNKEIKEMVSKIGGKCLSDVIIGIKQTYLPK